MLYITRYIKNLQKYICICIYISVHVYIRMSIGVFSIKLLHIYIKDDYIAFMSLVYVEMCGMWLSLWPSVIQKYTRIT